MPDAPSAPQFAALRATLTTPDRRLVSAEVHIDGMVKVALRQRGWVAGDDDKVTDEGCIAAGMPELAGLDRHTAHCIGDAQALAYAEKKSLDVGECRLIGIKELDAGRTPCVCVREKGEK